ncbi:MAG: DNA polymerase IV [Candidatus Diapherotrites archaeon]|uniref:DNA polymerase IV n=1 Tax=Candidatus Iainarchaeum sp. TaxID=3101447 RepID=A0A8T4C645_9ARCH|nr:DNA polymerase IV [Candidatus Diapherotrites archaeon]
MTGSLVPARSRLIAHIDMNAFFASVEQTLHPEWKNEPIVVCVFSGRSPSAGVVSSATYDARLLGVRAGMPIVQAQSLCPQAHFLPVQHEKYAEISEQIFTRLYALANVVEMASIDEAYADVSTKSRSLDDAAQKLRLFQLEIKKDFGLGCSIGLSCNKLVAKIASDFQKPNGFTLVVRENIQSFLDPLPVSKLMGVGPQTESVLREMNIHSIADLRVQSLSDLIKRFGQARGQWLFASSRGIDESPLQPEREQKQHSRMWTLVHDASSWEEIVHVVRTHADDLWNETAGKGNFFTQIGVSGITSQQGTFSKSKSFTVPLVVSEQFVGEIESLFQLFFENPLLRWRRIGIRVSGFASPPKQKRLGDF